MEIEDLPALRAIGGELLELKWLAATVREAQARDALGRVRELDPSWKPTPSAYSTVEGYIAAYQADAQEARDRLSQLQKAGIGPGPFADGSIPARGPERDFTAAERRAINQIGAETGCHTCGTGNPETPTGNFVIDHQPPTAWNPLGRSQRLYPQCLTCSSRQGNWISRNGGRR